MKAILASVSSVLFSGLLLGPQAFAASGNYQLSCTPAGSGATATLAVVVQIDQISGNTANGTALMNISLQNTNGSAPFSLQNVEVRGQMEQAVDNNGNHPYQVLFGQPVQANNGISYARIAVDDNDASGAPNSYIRDCNGVYYYAHCQNPGR